MRKNILLILFIPLSIFFLRSDTSAATPSVNGHMRIKKAYGGELVYMEGVPFLTCEGSYYEMGKQYGALLKNEIKHTSHELNELVRNYLILMPAILRPFAKLYIKILVRIRKNRIPEPYLDEIRGVSETSGVPEEDLLLGVFYPDMVGSLSCTSIIVPGNDLLHARNLDFNPPGLLGRNPVVIDYHPTGQIPYTSISIIGYLPCLTGMNDKGISVSINLSIMTRRIKKPGMPIGYKVRDILSRSSGLNDAEKFLHGYAPESGWIVSIGSVREKSGAIFDIAGASHSRHDARSGYIFAENRFLDKKLAFENQSIQKAGHEYNENRIKRLPEIMTMPASADSLFALLGDAAFEGYRDRIGFFTINNFETVQTIVMRPSRNEIYLSAAPGYSAWSRVIKYNRVSRKAILHKKEDPRFGIPEAANLTKWHDRLFSDFKSVASENHGSGLTWSQTEALFSIDGIKKGLINKRSLLPSLDRMIHDYPGYSYPWWRKGQIMLKIGKTAEAITLLETALTRPITWDYDMMESNAWLARACNDSGDKMRAKTHALNCIKLIKKYSIGQKEKEILSEMGDITRCLRKP